MVAVRSAHLNQDEQFELDKWIASLGQEPGVAKRLKEVYLRAEAILEGNDQGPLLLWRGREMIEILITLSMDKATLVAAMLFPLVASGAYEREQFEEDFGKETIKLIDGVEEMAALGQLNITLEGSAASSQVDNVRRMLLAMVDDFRCVVIKLAERICNLIEVKKAPDEVRRAAAKECANIYAPLANRLGIGQLKWEIEDYAFRYQQPETYKQIAKQEAELKVRENRSRTGLDGNAKISEMKLRLAAESEHKNRLQQQLDDKEKIIQKTEMALDAKIQLLEAKEEIVENLREKLKDKSSSEKTSSCTQHLENVSAGNLTSDTLPSNKEQVQQMCQHYEGKIKLLNEEISELNKITNREEKKGVKLCCDLI